MPRHDSYTRPPGLPDFRLPPVVEVVLAVRLETRELPPTNLALLANRIFGEELPHIEEQPRLEMPIEDLETAVGRPEVGVRMLTKPPPPRLWFTEEAGEHLVQVQDDFFARNWRLRDEGGSYPHYEAIRGPFEAGLEALLDAIGSLTGDRPVPVQCEVTYVNHITIDEDWPDPDIMARVVRFLLAPAKEGILSDGESAQLAMTFRVTEAEGSDPVGRLHVSAQPALREDGSPIVLLNLTARGAPMTPDVEGVMRFQDLGHESIVRGFAEVTTDEMQERWVRIDG